MRSKAGLRSGLGRYELYRWPCAGGPRASLSGPSQCSEALIARFFAQIANHASDAGIGPCLGLGEVD